MLRLGKTEIDVRRDWPDRKRGLSEGLLGRNSPYDTLPLALDAPLRVLFLRLLKADDRGGGRVIG